MKSSIALLFGSTASLVALLSISQPARAYRLFFGEDLNNTAYAPLTSYSNATGTEAQFLNNLVDVGTETFEGFSDNVSSPLTLDFGQAGQATLGGDGRIVSVVEGETNGYGRYGVSGSNYWQANAANDNFSIQFSQEVAAFGFYGVDLGDFGGQLTLNLAGGTQQTILVPNTIGESGSTDGSVLFFGLIAESDDEVFNGLSFDMEAPGTGVRADVFAFDNMTIGSLEQVDLKPIPDPKNVPEPSSILALLVLGTLAKGSLGKGRIR